MKKRQKKKERPCSSGYALVSVPPESAPRIGGHLCEGKLGIATMETTNRVFFLVDRDEVDSLFWPFEQWEAEIRYFENKDEATDWIEDELLGEEVRQSYVVH